MSSPTPGATELDEPTVRRPPCERRQFDAGTRGRVFDVVLGDNRLSGAPVATWYRYSFDTRLVMFWGVFGVRSAKDGVTVTDDGRLRATFGRARAPAMTVGITWRPRRSGGWRRLDLR
jgi:hypothetical protein